MKFRLSLLLLITSYSAYSQVNLKEYCPDKQSQYKATCASYAPTYTAFSIAYNRQKGNKKSDNNLVVFSEGFVASKIKSDKPFIGRLFNRCGRNVVAQDALSVLKKHGTVLKEDFTEGCACGKQKKVLTSDKKKYKIKDWKKITSTDEQTHINAIKKHLTDGSPVVITILQEGFFYSNKGKTVTFPTGYEKKANSANHVVTIIGYNNGMNGGSFLVKNNYTTWGESGYAYVKYQDLIKIIRDSFILII